MAEGVNQLTVQDLYANHCEKLSLQWVAGQQGGKRSIVPEDNQDTDLNIVDDDLNDPCNINLAKKQNAYKSISCRLSEFNSPSPNTSAG